MALESLLSDVSSFADISRFSFSDAYLVLAPLVVFVAGMVIYSIFVFRFYRFMARKDIFRLSRGGETSIHIRIAYAIEYLFLFPFLAFFWFFIIATLLAMFSEVITIANIFMVSMATMATIRLTAYYSEELSTEIAKLLPLALLAIFLLDISNLSVDAPLRVMQEIPAVADTLVYYFSFIVVMEFALKLLVHGTRTELTKEEKKRRATF